MVPTLISSHEAGHLVVAWYSGAAVGVARAYSSPSAGEGSVEFATADFMPKEVTRWALLVISVAGIAGQFRYGYRLFAPDALGDLRSAKKIAEGLARTHEARVAFPVDTGDRRTLTRMYAAELPDDVAHVIEAAYLKAVRVLKAYRFEFTAAALALDLFFKLDQRDLRLLFGKRRGLANGRWKLQRTRTERFVSAARLALGFGLVVVGRVIRNVWIELVARLRRR